MSEKKQETQAVKIEKTVLPKSKVKLTFSVAAKEYEKLAQKTAQELSSKMKFDGFRQGKVPEAVVERSVGKEVFAAEMTDRAVKKFYVDGILDEKILAIGSPEIKNISFGRGKDLIFEAEVAILPEIELGDWRQAAQKIRKKFAKEEVVVEEKEVQKELDFLADQRAKSALVNRPSQLSDQ